MNAENVLCAEMLLAKYFYDIGTEILVSECIDWVKLNMKGSGVRKTDIKEARKNLGIQSIKTEKGYTWVWKNEMGPEKMWILKSEEFLKCGK